jgi:polysaccharide pyruvyl transferase WcaK-like protein
MNRMILGGYYGMMNYGDDLFAIVSAAAAQHYWLNWDVAIMGRRINGVNSDFVVPDWFPQNLYASTGLAAKLSRLAFLLGGTWRANKFIFCGGSLFSSQSSGVRDVFCALKHNTPHFLSAIGVSIGPFSSLEDEKKINKILKNFEYLALRDEASYQIAQSFNLPGKIVLSGDLAGIMPQFVDSSGSKSANFVKRIGFSPCFLGKTPAIAKKYCDTFISSITHIKASVSDVHVVILNLNNHPKIGDVELSVYVKNELDQRNISNELLNYSDIGVMNTWKTIAGFDAYVSVRLHGAVSAYLTRTPFALFEYHVKCEEFLHDIGQNQSLRLGTDCDAKELTRVIFTLLTGTESSTQLKVNDYIARSQINFVSAPWLHA